MCEPKCETPGIDRSSLLERGDQRLAEERDECDSCDDGCGREGVRRAGVAQHRLEHAGIATLEHADERWVAAVERRAG